MDSVWSQFRGFLISPWNRLSFIHLCVRMQSMLDKFLNPKNDLAFKRIFGSEKNKDILIHFLNDVFSFRGAPIEDVTFLPLNRDPEIAALRQSVVDVLCDDKLGDRFIVEMQIDKEMGFIKRAQYYAAKTYIEQRDKNIEYFNLREVTFLAITQFVLFPNKVDYLCHHAMLDRKTGEQDLKDFSYSFLELPKFKKKKNELQTIIEKWAYFLKNAQKTSMKDLPLIVGSDKIIERAFSELDRYSWTPDELRAYDLAEMKRESDRAVMQNIRAEGKAEGKAEGALETSKSVAIQLLKKNMYIKDIAEITGLTVDDVKKLEGTE